MKDKILQSWWRSYCSADPQILKSDLQAKTSQYWNYGGTDDARLAFYVKNLLPQELYYAEQQGRLKSVPCDVLVLLVGYSMEPLFQTISVFVPCKKIVLLVNPVYDQLDENGKHVQVEGSIYGADVQEWVESLLLPQVYGRREKPATDVCVIGDVGDAKQDNAERTSDMAGALLPAAVFQTLCAYILREHRAKKKVVVDITGGKKSMDVGAFLFAAYADIPVSYVDFGEYHPKHRRPYGYTCRIGCLENPYAAFALKEWEEIRNLFENYHFHAAHETLDHVLKAMPELFTPLQIKAAKHLDQMLHLYAAWDDGDYDKAKTIADEIQKWVRRLNAERPKAKEVSFQPPAIVDYPPPIESHVELKALPTSEREFESWQRQRVTTDSKFLMSNYRLLAYVRDELEKIRRLVDQNEDNRSALLRAMGLDELLLKARWLRLYFGEKADCGGRTEYIDYYDEREYKATPSTQKTRKIHEKLVQYQGTFFMYNALAKDKPFYDYRLNKQVPPFLKIDCGQGNRYRARPKSDVKALVLLLSDSSNSSAYSFFYRKLIELRNQAIHKYQYVDQDIARAALALVEANLKEFETVNSGWLNLADDWTGEVESVNDPGRLDWEEICVLCSLDFLPF